jgi:hypothetical protein
MSAVSVLKVLMVKIPPAFAEVDPPLKEIPVTAALVINAAAPSTLSVSPKLLR